MGQARWRRRRLCHGHCHFGLGLSGDRDYGVFSPKTWRLADLGAKHAMLKAGLGWGSLPRPPGWHRGIGQHLITVLEEVDGKGMPHVAETDYAKTFDSRSSDFLALRELP